MNISYPISFKMCFGCSKEPSHWGGSFEYPHHTSYLLQKWEKLFSNTYLEACLKKHSDQSFKCLLFLSAFISSPEPSEILVFQWSVLAVSCPCQSTHVFQSHLADSVIAKYKGSSQPVHSRSTGPRSGVVNMSSNRCMSDCRSRGGEFDPGPVPYFCGDWLWNTFYSYSPPFRRIIQEGLLSVTSHSMCTNNWLTACSSLQKKKCGLGELTLPPWP